MQDDSPISNAHTAGRYIVYACSVKLVHKFVEFVSYFIAALNNPALKCLICSSLSVRGFRILEHSVVFCEPAFEQGAASGYLPRLSV
jgi:hypothetical protein